MVGRDIEEIEEEIEREYKYVLTWDEYFEALRNGNLLGLRCLDCGQVTCPPMAVCQRCGSTKLEKAELSGRGELTTLTVIYTASEGFESPFVFCHVKTEEGPWVPGRLDYDPEEAAEESPKLIGSKVEIEEGLELPGDKHSAGERVVPLFKFFNDE